MTSAAWSNGYSSSVAAPSAQENLSVPKPWGRSAEGPTFNAQYPVEFRQSQIPGAGRGMWATTDIPKGVMLRRVAVADGTLLCFHSEAELRATGWDIDECVNYGIGHHKETSAIFFLNPGTAMNHADPSRQASLKYNHDVQGELTLWTQRPVKAGEEIFNDYAADFADCPWYVELQQGRGNTPLSKLGAIINQMVEAELASSKKALSAHPSTTSTCTGASDGPPTSSDSETEDEQEDACEALSVHSFLLKFTPEQGKVPKPWGRSADGPTFNSQYPVEFRQSQIPDAGRGMWAQTDIPSGVMLRRVAVADGTLLRIHSEAELRATGWDVDEAVNYGIGHHKETSAIFFLNPGTAMNHADKTRVASVTYHHDVEGVLTLWTQRPIKAGEEIFNNYAVDFAACPWYDDLQQSRGNTPLSKLGALIDGIVEANSDHKVDHKVNAEEGASISQTIQMPEFLLKFTPKQGQVPKPWGRQAEGPTFNTEYSVEFRQSQIPNAGRGMWAKTDIPKGVMLRRLTVADGTLLRVGSEAELLATGWDIDDSVNYGIGHHKDASAIFFLNPGTAMNHADKTKEKAVHYNHDEEGVLSIWTCRDVKAGEEIFNDYGVDFGPCAWYDELQESRGNMPLSKLAEAISKMYSC